MASAAQDAGNGVPPGNQHKRPRQSRGGAWRTAITRVEPNHIMVRGFPVDEVMARVSFAEAIYLLLVGELPSPALGKLMEALLVSTIDHGTTPPSTLAARHVASTGAPMNASVAAGILAFGKYHGGDIEGGMRFLEEGVALVRSGMRYDEAATQLVARYRQQHEPVPGFGHRVHTHDPRTARLFQLALELDLEGAHMQMIRAVERALNATRSPEEPRIPINVDGAIAAICGDIGLDPSIGNALFIISRVPGLVAHVREERMRERRMRQIDTSLVTYDGPGERRLIDQRASGPGLR